MGALGSWLPAVLTLAATASCVLQLQLWGELLARCQHQSLGPKAHEAFFWTLELETLSGQPLEEWHQAAAGRAFSDTESKWTHTSQCESSAGPVSPVPLQAAALAAPPFTLPGPGWLCLTVTGCAVCVQNTTQECTGTAGTREHQKRKTANIKNSAASHPSHQWRVDNGRSEGGGLW